MVSTAHTSKSLLKKSLGVRGSALFIGCMCSQTQHAAAGNGLGCGCLWNDLSSTQTCGCESYISVAQHQSKHLHRRLSYIGFNSTDGRVGESLLCNNTKQIETLCFLHSSSSPSRFCGAILSFFLDTRYYLYLMHRSQCFITTARVQPLKLDLLMCVAHESCKCSA